ALTWWNSHVITVSHDVAYAMTWANLRKKMTDKYCPRNEMKKLEALALLCVRMFPEESDKIERYERIARHDPWKYCSIKAENHARGC
ncbi:hypothetical protein Tco_0493373, partial [Tanacetum coccineum]